MADSDVGYFYITAAVLMPFTQGVIEIRRQRDSRLRALYQGGIAEMELSIDGILDVHLRWFAKADQPSEKESAWTPYRRTIFRADLLWYQPSWTEEGMLSLACAARQVVITFYSPRHQEGARPTALPYLHAPMISRISRVS
ncbi:MAG: hypothetical protein WAP52_04415 [Candidatus Sungiibacteriota bacterium]